MAYLLQYRIPGSVRKQDQRPQARCCADLKQCRATSAAPLTTNTQAFEGVTGKARPDVADAMDQVSEQRRLACRRRGENPNGILRVAASY